MKLIIAYIQTAKLNAVKKALFAQGIYHLSITNALGCGRQMGYVITYRGTPRKVQLLKKLRIAIAVEDSWEDQTISLIAESACSGNIGDGKINRGRGVGGFVAHCSGNIGDGKIFVLPMNECIRIRTGERGPAAVGDSHYLSLK